MLVPRTERVAKESLFKHVRNMHGLKALEFDASHISMKDPT